MRLTGAFFDLTDRIVPKSAAPGRRGKDKDRKDNDRKDKDRKDKGDQDAGDKEAGGKVLISVAKRLVPSAVRRNTVKRIVREAWRGALLDSAERPGPESTQGVCLVRLKRYPETGEQTAAGLTMIKQSLRTDVQALFTTYHQRRRRQRSLSHGQPSAGPVPVSRSGTL